QASRLGETRRCEEIGRRGKRLDGVTQRPHQPSHRLAKEPVIFDDRYQQLFVMPPLAVRAGGSPQCRRSAWVYRSAENATVAMPVRRKFWLITGRELRRLGAKKRHRAVSVGVNLGIFRACAPAEKRTVQAHGLGLDHTTPQPCEPGQKLISA